MPNRLTKKLVFKIAKSLWYVDIIASQTQTQTIFYLLEILIHYY